jgi:hypothetical protein
MAKNAKKNGKQPNILVIWGDDIGQSNLSCYTHGLMGYRTPNIDRIAKEECSSLTPMASRAALRDARRLSPGRASTAPDFRKSAFPPRRSA